MIPIRNNKQKKKPFQQKKNIFILKTKNIDCFLYIR